MNYYLYLVEYLNVKTRKIIERYHLSNDLHELERQTYLIDDCIPKRSMSIGEFNLPSLSHRRYLNLQKEINRVSCPERLLDSLSKNVDYS